VGFHTLIFSLGATISIIYVVAKAAFLGWVLPSIHNFFYCFYFFAISIIFLDRLNTLRKVMFFYYKKLVYSKKLISLLPSPFVYKKTMEQLCYSSTEIVSQTKFVKYNYIL